MTDHRRKAPPAAERYAAPPLAIELSPPPDPIACFQRLAHRPGCLFLDSALRHATLGRYSFLACDPFETLDVSSARDPLLDLERAVQRWQAATVVGLPPFQGGWAGYLAYELNGCLERLPPPRRDEFQLPALSLAAYDCLLAWDHQLDLAWILSHGFPESDPARRRIRAEARAAELARRIAEPSVSETVERPSTRLVLELSADDLAPSFPVPHIPGVWSDLDRAAYLSAIRRAIELIHAGDVFQVNLAQRLLVRAKRDPRLDYLALRRVNPAPFAAFYRFPGGTILSASPERFFAVRGRQIETRPIKGTRRRSGFPESDLLAAEQLLGSEKDRAENTMIVDLLRNDLARCCEDPSIRVTQWCEVERYASVLHLVSAVTGTLREHTSFAAVLAAMFPGGSVTGAPKVRAMEIIAELEPTARGPYCGAMAYLGFDGTADTSILIRTAIESRGWLQIPVGGGIVADSDPELEYDETWAKAASMLHALRCSPSLDSPRAARRVLAP